MDRSYGAMLQGEAQKSDRTFPGVAVHSGKCGSPELVLKL